MELLRERADSLSIKIQWKVGDACKRKERTETFAKDLDTSHSASFQRSSTETQSLTFSKDVRCRHYFSHELFDRSKGTIRLNNLSLPQEAGPIHCRIEEYHIFFLFYIEYCQDVHETAKRIGSPRPVWDTVR